MITKGQAAPCHLTTSFELSPSRGVEPRAGFCFYAVTFLVRVLTPRFRYTSPQATMYTPRDAKAPDVAFKRI